MTRKPRTPVRIFVYRMWSIQGKDLYGNHQARTFQYKHKEHHAIKL